MKPSIPITHSVHLHKSYEIKNLLLHAIYYETYSSKTCGDLKLIEMLIGMQPGFKEQYCFLRRCDSWATDENYIKSSWPPRALYQLGLCSINTPLVDSRNVLLPPLHILLGLNISLKHLEGETPEESNILKKSFLKSHTQSWRRVSLSDPKLEKYSKTSTSSQH